MADAPPTPVQPSSECGTSKTAGAEVAKSKPYYYYQLRATKSIQLSLTGKALQAVLKEAGLLPWSIVRFRTGRKEKRVIRYIERQVKLQQSGTLVKQIIIAGRGNLPSGLLITRELGWPAALVVKAYVHRCLVEAKYPGQTHFLGNFDGLSGVVELSEVSSEQAFAGLPTALLAGT